MSRPHPTRLHSRLRLLCIAGVLAIACSVTVPTLLPPPFDTDGKQESGQPRLLLPTGIAAAPSGQVLVASSNLDRTYDSGTLLSFSPAFIAGFFDAPADVVATSATLPRAPDVWAAMVPDYAGPIALDQDGTTVWMGSRTTNLATAVRLDPATGKLSCAVGAGQDCRAGTVNLLATSKLEGAYGVVPGLARLPGDGADHRVMFIASLVPHIDEVQSGVLQAFGRVAAVLSDAPTQVLYTIDISNPNLSSAIGAGTVIYDAARQQVILGGCYTRFTASSAGDPATSKCSTASGINPIRFVDVTAGSLGQVRVFELTASVRGNETTALVLGGEDGAGVPQVLYAVSRNPDVLVEIALPTQPGQDPLVRRAVALPVSPSHAIRLKRPAGHPGSDLLAITGSANGTISIYDAAAGEVVGQVNGLGDYPFQIAQVADPGDRARLVATVFGGCGLAFVDVDYAQPWNARLRATIGKCK